MDRPRLASWPPDSSLSRPRVIHVGPLCQVEFVGGSDRDQDLDRDRRPQHPASHPASRAGATGAMPHAQPKGDEPAVRRNRQTRKQKS